MKFLRLTHILFLFLALFLVIPFLSPSAHAQTPGGVTPKFSCLGPCPTLPVKPTQSVNQNTTQPSGAVPSPSKATTPSSTPAVTSALAQNTEPCGDTSLSSLTNPPSQSPFVAPDQRKTHGSKHHDKNSDNRGGFLNELFQLLIMFLELLLKTGGGGSLALPCTTPTISPVATNPSPSVSPTTTATQPIGSHASGNWAGYAINTSPSQGGYVTTTWPVTNVPCVEQQKGHASSWPGMGGEGNDPNIAQVGTAEICEPSTGKYVAGYYAWTERYPDPVAPLDYNKYDVRVGDQFTATITYQGQGKFATTMTNKTLGWTISMPMSFDASYVPQSSEIITESTDNFPIVPKFETINYPGSFYSPDGQQKLPLSKAPKLEKIVNKSANGILRTDTSPITGDTFFTNWTHN